MRNISFALTTAQFLDGTKDVTRRLGCLFLKPGDTLMAVEKCQGLGKGGKVKRLGEILIVDVEREPLDRMLSDKAYGESEVAREGFPDMAPSAFVRFFCDSHRECAPASLITRIAFARGAKP
jgi:hypothetical protein